ncbi:hypothetical protein B0H16DRAFT_1617164 [Mycena metata]|uniref:Uncharacterized protein n=1 Tax=Mycena metata TaxID=1033252 RepID=A0AAD7H939_9AGAR|nr:hypothetical protein B0H16DRAFT_1617164 [Mycena metata]
MGSVRLGLLILWLLAMAGQTLSTEGIQISSLYVHALLRTRTLFNTSLAAQCDILNITWTGGTPGTDLGGSETIATGVSTFNYSWQVNFPAGLNVALEWGTSSIARALATRSPSLRLVSTNFVHTGGLPCLANSNCLVETTPTGANPTPNTVQPTDTTLPSSTGSGSSHIAAIGGGTAGGATALLLIGLRLWYSWMRRQPSNTALPTTVFGAHEGMVSIAGPAAPVPITGGVSTQSTMLRCYDCKPRLCEIHH